MSEIKYRFYTYDELRQSIVKNFNFCSAVIPKVKHKCGLSLIKKTHVIRIVWSIKKSMRNPRYSLGNIKFSEIFLKNTKNPNLNTYMSPPWFDQERLLSYVDRRRTWIIRSYTNKLRNRSDWFNRISRGSVSNAGPQKAIKMRLACSYVTVFTKLVA